jgi:hypothetical protein
MNKEEIAQLMNETSGQSFGTESHFQRFAALVAAAEREACAAMCDEAKALRLGEIIRERGQHD